MSRTAPLEVCARCELFKPANEMVNVYARDASGQVITLRLCRTCVNPVLTYIAGRLPRIVPVDSGQVLIASLVLILVVLDVIFGLVIGGSHGFAIALAGMLAGAGVLVSLAVTEK